MADPNKVSIGAFAKLHGKSKQAAAKWKARGHLVMDEGLVVVDASDARLKEAELGRFAPAAQDDTAAEAAPVKAVTRGGRQTVERAADHPAPVQETPLDFASFEDFIEKVMRGDFASRPDAERIKENALAGKHLLDAKKKAGELIECASAEAILFEVFRSFRDAWLNFPSGKGPLIAAELGIEPERVVEVLKKHVHQQLEDLGEPEADFTGDGPDDASSQGGKKSTDPAAED